MAGVPYAAVGFLLENLQQFVTNNGDLIAGAEEYAKTVCQELEELRQFLQKCYEEYSNNDFLDRLAKTAWKLVYRAEDVIETYIATALEQKRSGAVRGSPHAIDHTMELRNISGEVKTIKQELQKLHSIKIERGFKALQLDNARLQGQRFKNPPVDDDMVGIFGDEVKHVVQLLTGGPESVETVSIVGMLGLGKTTLARKVLKHPTVEYHFLFRSFVEVSAECKAKDVFLKILQCFGNFNDEMNGKSEDELAQYIKNYLETGSYLMVLDDVSTCEAWDDLKRVFPKNQNHSRVLITTRNMPVAVHAMQGHEPLRLRFLCYFESQELLRKKVFGNDPFPSDLAEHEKRILHRCEGLPLAILVVAGILMNHRTEGHWWRKVAENMDTYNLASTGQIDHIINLSFNDLPHRLRPCFLYLGVFPEDFEIPSKELLRLWVSEGFVLPSNREENLEDIAEDYLEELVGRSLVMVDRRGSNGRIKTIRIHDTLREFCKAQAIKEDLFREIKRPQHETSISPDDDRRICINSEVVEYIKSKPSGKYVRSFLTFVKEDPILPMEYIMHIPAAFKLVKVLDIRAIKLTWFPRELCYLFLLKYIAMFCDRKIIPEKMSNLTYLQTLIFETTERALAVKADIWKMTQLRHLETNVSTSLVKAKEASSINSNLQTLSEISLESCRKDVFYRAPKLKKLCIRGKLGPAFEATGEGSLFDTLSELEFLKNLKLLNDDYTTARLYSLAAENSFPANLTRLTLQTTMLDWRSMSILGKLKKLVALKLKNNAFLGAFWDTENDCFHALKVFRIERTDLVIWKASACNFPSLTHLYLKHCTKLEAIPYDLVNVFTLQLMDIYRCNSSVALCARKHQVARLQRQVEDKDDKRTTLKLLVYPPDE